MNNTKIAKINLHDMIKPLAVYYAILCTVVTCVILFVKIMKPVKGNVSGIDLVTVVFIFICGLCSFNENFRFAKCNNVSRKSLAQGLILSCIPIAFITSVFDFIINRIANIFIPVPNFYEMSYGRTSGPISLSKSTANWALDNSLSAVTETIILQFLMVLAAFILGLAIASILYRCNKHMKAFVWIAGCIILNLILNVEWVSYGMKLIFGLNNKNVFLGFISLILMSIIFSVSLILISRRAQVK